MKRRSTSLFIFALLAVQWALLSDILNLKADVRWQVSFSVITDCLCNGKYVTTAVEDGQSL